MRYLLRSMVLMGFFFSGCSVCEPRVVERVVYLESNCTEVIIPDLNYTEPTEELFEIEVIENEQ